MEFEELKSQMATRSAQITSLLGKVVEMIAQNRKQCRTIKGAKRQSVGKAMATTKVYEKKKQNRGQEQRVLNQIGSRKGVFNYVPRVGGKVPAKPK